MVEFRNYIILADNHRIRRGIMSRDEILQLLDRHAPLAAA
jgi:hypothetical protein